ncbi:MAG: aspartate aminotransferase family protein [Geodermatophilaceae bacterium]|nr:aspartate aminotransferase family protein [Geodermatophilaceae bacterium]
MSADQFRAHGRQVIDWIADYWESLEARPVRSQVAPGHVVAAMRDTPPETGEPFEALLADIDDVVLPGITHWQHPRHFAYFPANASGPAILGDLLSSGLGVQGMLWVTSPACTEVETVVVDWMRQLLGLPERFSPTSAGGGVIEDSASSASLVALLAALHRASAGAVTRDGIDARYAVYVSSQTHSSVEKAARIAGLGAAALRSVDVDPATLAMDPEDLRRRLRVDLAAGVVPAMVCATVGTTSTTAIDPVAGLGPVCAEFGVWLHVDAAYAGVAAVCPELRWINDGVAEYADSYATDPHKWLLTNFDCTAFWVADRAALIGALSVLPEYLRNEATASGGVVDYRDWQVPLGRRFRALKLWAVLRWYGAEGLRAHIRRHVAMAQEFAGCVAADPDFEVVAPHPLSLVVFRPRWPGHPDPAAATMAVLERLNADGELFLTHCSVHGVPALRLAIGSPSTEREHVAQAWVAIRAAVAAQPVSSTIR